MKVLVTGATGFVGKRLITRLRSAGHEVVITTRNGQKAKKIFGDQVKVVEWNAPHGAFPQEALNGVEGIINLMGENLAQKRWSPAQKLILRESRTEATKKIVKAISDQSLVPKVFVSTSAIGYYPANLTESLSEEHEAGESFLSALCIDWEKAIEQLPQGTRSVILRVGVVLGKEGGALAKLYPLFKLGLGGPVGAGAQVMSWIHVEDLVSLFKDALENSTFTGIFNAVAPRPVTNKEFTKALARAVKRPALFPAPPAALKLAMGEMSSIVLDSQSVDCKRLKELNYTFSFPTIERAFEDICKS
jgi:uncharacterized protein